MDGWMDGNNLAGVAAVVAHAWLTQQFLQSAGGVKWRHVRYTHAGRSQRKVTGKIILHVQYINTEQCICAGSRPLASNHFIGGTPHLSQSVTYRLCYNDTEEFKKVPGRPGQYSQVQEKGF